MLSRMSEYIDVIVPRGGKGLVAKVQKLSNIHVIGHLEGLCHAFVEKSFEATNNSSTPMNNPILILVLFMKIKSMTMNGAVYIRIFL